MSNYQTTVNANKMIRGEIYDTLRKSLCSPASARSKKSFYEDFIQRMLEEAKKNPCGPLGQLLSRQIMQEDILDKLDSETEKLLARDVDFLEYRLCKQLYDEQKLVVMNTVSKNIILCTGRRTGKTNLLARWLVFKCTKPNSPCLYIHTKFENAIRQCFQLCVDAANAIELNIVKSSENEGVILFSNGSSIKFTGNSNRAAADTLRGYKYRAIAIDEAAFQCNMQYLIEDVCTPMLMDYTDSQLILASTPPRAPHTYYERCLLSNKWKTYEWDASKNPFIHDFDEYVKSVCANKGLTLDSPFIQREFYGKLAYDTEAQVFKDYKTYKKDNPPDFPIDYIYIGNDYGWAAYNGIVGVACNTQMKKGYVFFEEKFNHATVTDIINSNKRAMEAGKKLLIKYNAELGHIGIYGDTSDTSIIYEMNTVHHLPAWQCYKYDKETAIVQLAEFCRTGQILIPEGGFIADEFDQVLYKRDEEDNITSEIDDENAHPDIAMALLYASRQFAYAWGVQNIKDNTKKIGDYI